jgi:HPt (histidine-containing phosphotransfer) domain-containing protein
MLELSGMLERWAAGAPSNASASTPEVVPEKAFGVQTVETEPECLDRRVLDNILSLSGVNGRKMLEAVIGIYINDSPVLLDKLGKTLEAGDASGMAKAAHALKSTSGNLGAVCLAEICKKVEDIAWTNSTEGTADLIVQIRVEYEKVHSALEGELQRGN